MKSPNTSIKLEEPKRGVVTNCVMMYLRRQPDANSEACLILPALSEVIIDPGYNNPNYYRVVIPSIVRRSKFANYDFNRGYHGYCNSQYITIKE